MARKSGSTVGLELSPTYLKMVEFLPRENQISVVAIRPLEPSGWKDDEYLAGEIRTCLNKYVKKSGVELVACVPGEHTIIREIEIPNQEDNLVDAIEWELEQYLVAPIGEYLIDFQALGSSPDETARNFLVAAYRRTEVVRLRQVLEQSGYPLAVMDVDVFAAQNAFEVNYPEKRASRTFLVKADSHGIKCLRTQHGRFLGLENLAIPEEFAVMEGEARTEMAAQLAEKVRDGLDLAAGQWGEVDELVLCGDLAMDDGFRAALQSGISMEILPLNAFKEVAFALGPDKSAAFAPTAPHCAAAVGLALRRVGDC